MIVTLSWVGKVGAKRVDTGTDLAGAILQGIDRGLARLNKTVGLDREVELKLQGQPEALNAIFGGFPGEIRASDIVSTYYDTDDNRLWQRGFSLRLRQKKGRFELTLKTTGGALHDRGEWTAALDEPVVDIAALPSGAPRGAIGMILPEELHPRFATEIKRKTKNVALGTALVEVALDNGEIVAGDRRLPVNELEYELLGGDFASLLKHVRTAVQSNKVSLGTRSKSDRGVSLAEGSPPATLKAARPVLDPSETVESAMAKIVSVTAVQIIGNLAASADGRDPEGVHQLRVGLRRLRSAFTLFKDQLGRNGVQMSLQAKRAFAVLGDARDLDVFLLETLPPVRSGNEDISSIDRLAAAAESGQQKAYDAVRKLIGDRRFNLFLVDLLLASETGGLIAHDRDARLLPVAARILQKRHKKVLKAGKNFADLDYDARHEVRIELKKLRYACDFFSSLFPKGLTKAYLKRMSSLQDDMGRLNDATVAGILVDRLSENDGAAAAGAGLVKGWYQHRLQTNEPHMLEDWRRFTEAKPFWTSRKEI